MVRSFRSFVNGKHNSLTGMNALGFVYPTICSSIQLPILPSIQPFRLFFFRFCLLSHSADVPLNNLNNSENRFINATRCKQFSTSVAFAHGFIAMNYTLPIELSKNKPKRKKNCEEFFVVLYNSAYCEYQHIS